MFDAVTYAAAVAAAKKSGDGVRFFSTHHGNENYISPDELAPLIENGERFKIETFVYLMGQIFPVLLDSGLFVTTPFGGVAASTVMYFSGVVVMVQLTVSDDDWNIITKLLSATDIPD